ncbi:MAG: RdgB/HAM1 family non-canonical purine NTP pyrophosphatase [Anaerolineae bacterium]|nr:RdgB/HAM1 family non-canonical purine NTP pyrophosphatase [Anaerolineae bacterium]
MIRVMVGTSNPGKQQEYRDLLADVPAEWIGPAAVGLQDFEADESGTSFLANARRKARSYAQAAGLPTLADDSGLVVDALDGAPGIYSARYAGPGASDEDRYRKLLGALQGVPEAARAARFVCVVALALPDGTTHVARGTFAGRIGDAPCGTHGFGYDPVFVLPDGRHLAELPGHEKHVVSHRGRALAALKPTLLAVLASLNA